MNNKKLTILVVVAMAMLALTVALHLGTGRPAGDFVPGAALIQGLDPAAIHKIIIKKGTESATLTRHGKAFAVAEKDNYPASVKEINDLIIKSLEIRCAEKITDSEKSHADLGVTEDSQDALSVSLLGAKDEPLIGFITGKSSEKSSGVYVRLQGKNTVYRTESPLWMAAQPTSYINTDLTSVDKKDVERVEVTTPEDSYTISRVDDKKIALQNIPEGKRVKGTEHENVFHALAGLRLTDVKAAVENKYNWDTTYACHLENGLSYTVRLAKNDGKHYISLSATGPRGDSIEISKDESDEELKKKEAILLAMEKASKSNTRHAQWIYEISGYNAENMRKPFAELIEDIPDDATPEEIAASHILISYKGSERSQATRTKEQAKALAESALKDALKEGADFAALARKHSDGPSKAKGADLGAFKKGAMAPAFEEAAFKL
ncbi:MAG: peptidylprolyl isomerase, partial [Planctomycetes bacterium]|nr:peptidylprolyl isomerase [Planctomycetota bacterium]